MGAFVSSPACPQQSAPLGLFLNTYLHKFYICVSATKQQRLKPSICNLYSIELISGMQSGTDWQDTTEEDFLKFTNCVLKARNVMIHLFEGEKAASWNTVAHAHSDRPKGNHDANLISHLGSNKPIVTGSFS